MSDPSLTRLKSSSNARNLSQSVTKPIEAVATHPTRTNRASNAEVDQNQAKGIAEPQHQAIQRRILICHRIAKQRDRQPSACAPIVAAADVAAAIGGKGAFERTRALIAKIKAKHSGIADCFGTGAGLRLMRIDSDMAESVQLKLIGRGAVGLPIHDSFIVEERHAGILKEIMDEVFSLTLRRISGRRLSSIRLSKNVPQYGGRREGGCVRSGCER